MKPDSLFSLRVLSISTLLAAIAIAACGCAEIRETDTYRLTPAFDLTQETTSVPILGVRLVRSYPHDSNAFTQGLEYYRGYLYESTGIAGQSTVRKVALNTGQVVQKISLPPEYFGEGLTIFRGKIYQLTWLSKKGFIYDLRSFRQVGEFAYQGEGWGLTHDETSLIMSDGTNKLRYLDPVSFAVTRIVEVYAGGQGVVNLNELEFVKGEIWANIWHSSRIARIDPNSGQVIAWIDLGAIAATQWHTEEAVLNGIAYDRAGDRVFVTGKNWTKLFQVKVDATPR